MTLTIRSAGEVPVEVKVAQHQNGNFGFQPSLKRAALGMAEMLVEKSPFGPDALEG